MIDELGMIWKKGAMAKSMYYLRICLEILRKIMKTHGHDSQCPS
jgi:hypothetical protein